MIFQIYRWHFVVTSAKKNQWFNYDPKMNLRGKNVVLKFKNKFIFSTCYWISIEWLHIYQSILPLTTSSLSTCSQILFSRSNELHLETVIGTNELTGALSGEMSHCLRRMNPSKSNFVRTAGTVSVCKGDNFDQQAFLCLSNHIR